MAASADLYMKVFDATNGTYVNTTFITRTYCAGPYTQSSFIYSTDNPTLNFSLIDGHTYVVYVITYGNTFLGSYGVVDGYCTDWDGLNLYFE